MKKIISLLIAVAMIAVLGVPALASEQLPIFGTEFVRVENEPTVEYDEWEIPYNVWTPVAENTAIAVGDTVTMVLTYAVPAEVEGYDARLVGSIEYLTEIEGIDEIELVEAYGCDPRLNCDYEIGICVPVPGEYANIEHDGTTLKVMAELGSNVTVVVRGTATADHVIGSMNVTIGQRSFPAYFYEKVVDKTGEGSYNVHWSDFTAVQKRSVECRPDNIFVGLNNHYYRMAAGRGASAFIPVDENFEDCGDAIDNGSELFATLSDIFETVHAEFGIDYNQVSFTDEDFIGSGEHYSFEYPYDFGANGDAEPTEEPAPADPTEEPAPADPTDEPAPADPTEEPAPAEPTAAPHYGADINNGEVRVVLSTDKEVYEGSDPIVVTVSATCVGDANVTDMLIVIDPVAGYELQAGSSLQGRFGTIAGGETVHFSATFIPNDGGIVPPTGDNTIGMIAAIVITLGIAAFGFAAISGRKNRRFTATMLLAVMILSAAAGLGAVMADTLGAGSPVLLNKTVSARGASTNISATVHYSVAEPTFGSVNGRVFGGIENPVVLENATVTAYSTDAPNTVAASVTTDANGYYALSLVSGSYRLVAEHEGYLPCTVYDVNVREDEMVYVQNIYLIPIEQEGQYFDIYGIVRNALTNQPIEGVSVKLRYGWNTYSGSIASDMAGEPAVTSTDENGAYTLNNLAGYYTAEFSKEGFVTGYVNVFAAENQGSQDAVLTPILSNNEYRIVLTWGENPRDIDSHVEGKLTNGSNFHVYFSHKNQMDGDVLVCSLDVDDTTSYGPETITLNPTVTDPYYYYVHHYAGSGSISDTSNAIVKVYCGDALIHTFNVPANQGDGKYWNVFALVDGEIVVRNTITSSPDTGYAN